MRRSALNRNHYFFIGLVVGLVLSFYIPQDIWELVQQECPQEAAENNLIEKFGEDFEPHLNLINKPLAAKKPIKNVIRPRYYSSELGIREKIFIGVMTSQDNINSAATAINRTAAHLVNKIKFFINAVDMKTNYKLKNIVGFTDTRESLRSFHVIKYIADNYLDDYDYFLIIMDSVYVDARKLRKMLDHLSITFDIYMGSRLRESATNGSGGSDASVNSGGVMTGNDNDNDNDYKLLSDRNYCDLNAGILLSSSVVRKMRNNLDWCVRNGVTNVHSVNIGRCVRYSSRLSGCQERFQGMHQRVYELKPTVRLYKDMNTLAKEEAFQNAATVYPVVNTDDFYRLHAFYSRHHLKLAQQRSSELERKSYHIANGTISNDVLEIRWPLGVPFGSSPETRHDIIMWHLINGTHIFVPNAADVVRPLNRIESIDFAKVLNVTEQYARSKYPTLRYETLHSAYRRFDATRGMDYQMHLTFSDAATRGRPNAITKSFQVVKPLGRVEVVPSPYVTESTRITILVPTFEYYKDDALDFINQYERVCMRNQDNTFLLMVFLYRYDSSSKGESDPFKSIKTLALDLSSKYKADGSRIAWVSIRLPAVFSGPRLPADVMLSSMYAQDEILSIAVADLALPKIGLDSLVLMASTSVVFKSDFLNRVRMNTIQGFQVYSPIGFMMYPCALSMFCKECEVCDVSQATGYFDKWNYDVISFYSRDYVQARKLIEPSLTIVRSDNDIEALLSRSDSWVNNVMDMFVASKLSVHILRGVEPNLRFGLAIKNFVKTSSDIPRCPLADREDVVEMSAAEQDNKMHNYSHDNVISNRKCIHLGSRKQIGDAIIRYEDRSIQYK